MSERISDRIASDMAHVSSAADARHVSEEFTQAIYGMNRNQALAFARDVREARVKIQSS